jgi:hypothetical protein
MEERYSRLFRATLGFTFLIKALLALAIPITSDEAYFTLWAMYPDFGYYDHPPMAGWMLYVLSFFGHSTLLFRLPAILSTILIGAGIYLVLKEYDRQKAYIASVFSSFPP